MAIIFALLGILLGFFILFSGPAALIWLFFLRNRLNDLAERNAQLEAALRRLQRDVQNNKTTPPKSKILTVETEVPVQSAAQSPHLSTPPPKNKAFETFRDTL